MFRVYLEAGASRVRQAFGGWWVGRIHSHEAQAAYARVFRTRLQGLADVWLGAA